MTETIRKEALEFLKSVQAMQMATVEGDTPDVRTMMTARVDDDFTVWFATSTSTNKVKQLGLNPKTCINADQGMQALRIDGKAAILTDRATKDELWRDEWKAYWPEGAASPDLAILKITPGRMRYVNVPAYGHGEKEL